MTELIKYQLIVTVCTAVFYSFYKLFLNNETFFNINRFLILIFISISFLIPLIQIETTNPVIIQSTQNINKLIVFETNNTITPVPDIKPKIQTEKISAPAAPSRSLNYLDVIMILYFSGIVYSLVKLLKTFSGIYKLKKKSDYNFLNGANYYLVRDNLGSFSFFNTIFISESAFSKHEANAILSHERIHVNGFHSLDMIFLALVKSIQWFNPFIYMIEKELKTVHEYIADSNVIKIEKNQDLYIDVLLNQSIGAKLSDLTNNFNSTTIIRRLKMITKTKSSKSRLWRYSIFILPLTISIILFSCKDQHGKYNKYGYEIDTVKHPVKPSYSDFWAKPEMDWDKYIELIDSIKKMPEEAKKNNIVCELWLGFDLDSNGKMVNFTYNGGQIEGQQKTLDGIGYGIDQEAFRVIKIIAEKVKWLPSRINNKPIKDHLTFYLSFGEFDKVPKYNKYGFELDPLIQRKRLKIDVFAEPEIGWKKWSESIKSNQKMPEEAKKHNITCELWIGYDVDTNGHISNFKYHNGKIAGGEWSQNGIGYGIDKAVFDLMHYFSIVKFKPAIYNNKPVKQHLYQTFSFGDPEVWKMYHVSPAITYSAGGSNCMFEISNPCSKVKESDPSFFTEDHYQQIYNNIKYPEDALKNKKGGELTISFGINNTGEVTNPRIDKKIGYGLDEAALKAFGNVHGLIVNGFDHKGKTYKLKIKFTPHLPNA